MFNQTGNLMLHTALILAVGNQIPVGTHTLEHNKKAHKGVKDPADVCYGDYGCYSIKSPWVAETRPIANYPDPPEKIDPIFCLYTRKNPVDCQRLKHDEIKNITNSHLVPTLRTYTIAHGFLENGFKKWIQVLTRKLLNKSDCNVIVIGWGGGSSPPYTQAVANIRLVGTMTAFLIHSLHKHVGLKTEFIHAIGHSLGSHLSAYVGSTLQQRFNLTLGRITALDPAEPHFSETDPIVRLDPSDALFVDVIHTDATPFIKGGLGMNEPVGHLDFYPNSGADQPGCDHSVQGFIDKSDGSLVKGIRRFLNCDHVRSYEYFMESISERCGFLAVECDSWENFLAGNCFGCRNEVNPNGSLCSKMGFHSIKTVQEEYGLESGEIHPTIDRSLVKLYTITNNQQPYCKSLYRVSINMSSSALAKEHGGEVGAFSIQLIGIKGRTTFLKVLREQPFKPGGIYTQVVAGAKIGRVRSAVILWSHTTSLNVLTWRFSIPKIYLGSVTVDNLEEDSSVQLCLQDDEILATDRERELRPCSDIAIESDGIS